MPDTDAQGKRLYDGEEGAHATPSADPLASYGATRRRRAIPLIVDLWDSYLEPA